jgi:UDP-2-acetamido-3-amino-2,3-dideoxy-glucuronate N-acetyltransferase
LLKSKAGYSFLIMNFFAHPTAIIDEGSSIGSGTKIWHFSHIMTDSIIGANCILGQNVFIGSKVKLGDNVKVQNNVSLYEGVICEDDVFIGPSAVFTNVINPRSAVPRKDEFRATLVKKGATIGANATIICGNEIGQFAFIGAGTVVTKPVPDYALIIGNPGRQTGWISEKGIQLRFDDNGIAVCPVTGDQYQYSNNIVSKSVSIA